MNENYDELDNMLFDYFKANNDVPNIITEKINKALNSKPKHNRILEIIKKFIITIISIGTITGGIVFAKEIKQFIENLFQDSVGVSTAIENGYVYETPEITYSESENTKIHTQEMIMDDYKLDLNFLVEFAKEINVTEIESFNIPDMLVVDESNNIICSWNLKSAQKFYEEKGLNNDIEYILKNTVNVGSSIYITRYIDENSIVFTLNCSASGNKLPESKKLYIKFSTITLKNSKKDYTVTGNWSFEINVPDKFSNRQATIYKVVDCNNSNVHNDSITAEVYETGMKFKMSMHWGDYEYWNRETDKIRLNNALNSQYIKQEECYVENERGEKFSPSMISSNDSICILSTDGELRKEETFNLTKFDATNKLKVVLTTIKDKQIIINLQKQ